MLETVKILQEEVEFFTPKSEKEVEDFNNLDLDNLELDFH